MTTAGAEGRETTERFGHYRVDPPNKIGNRELRRDCSTMTDRKGSDRHDWDKRFRCDDLTLPAHPNPFLVEDLASTPPGRALDLGTGEGRHAVWLAEMGWEVTAVDFSIVGLSKGKRWADRLGVRVAWLAADLADFEPPPIFDLVVVSFVHFAGMARRRFLLRAAGSLLPGGALIVVGYDRSNGAAVGPGRRGPDMLMTPEELAADLAGPAGLRIERAERLRVPVPKMGEAEADRCGSEVEPAEIIDVFVRAVRPT